MLEIIDVEQNTPEWIAARMGIVTASKFGTVLADKPGKDKTRSKYMRELVAERISGEPTENLSNGYTERGHEIEPEAISWYEFSHDVECQKVGFFKDGNKGCSPDRLVGTNGMVQAKSRKGDLQIELLLKGQMPSTHIPQIQGEIWIAEKEWSDFVCYSRGMPVFEQRIYRDDKYISHALWPAVDRFITEMLELEEKIRNV